MTWDPVNNPLDAKIEAMNKEDASRACGALRDWFCSEAMEAGEVGKILGKHSSIETAIPAFVNLLRAELAASRETSRSWLIEAADLCSRYEAVMRITPGLEGQAGAAVGMRMLLMQWYSTGRKPL